MNIISKYGTVESSRVLLEALTWSERAVWYIIFLINYAKGLLNVNKNNADSWVRGRQIVQTNPLTYDSPPMYYKIMLSIGIKMFIGRLDPGPYETKECSLS